MKKHKSLHMNVSTQHFIMVLLSLIKLSLSQDPQNFTYTQSDIIIIKPNQNTGIYGSLTTVADQYLSSSSINITNSISQSGTNKSNFAVYNMYYFNLGSQEGSQCYKNWMLGGVIPFQSGCPLTTYLYQQECHNFSGCYDQNITYSLALNQWEQVQHIFYIHNVHPQNQLNLKTQVSMILVSSNAWFFWAVGMTCLLMIMIVVLSGVVFNLNLKMKRTKKVYEQHRLTLQNQIDFVIKDDSQTKSE